MSPEELQRRFTHHPPGPQRARHHESLRATVRRLAETIGEHTPAGYEQDLAITHLEQALMWANAALARPPRPTTERPHT